MDTNENPSLPPEIVRRGNLLTVGGRSESVTKDAGSGLIIAGGIRKGTPCAHCGTEFVALRNTAKFCSDVCRFLARTKGKPFVALDGEGASDEYVLLAASTGQYLGNKKGLSTEECLEFLLKLPRGSRSGIRPIHIWFAFDYDVNMMLKDVPLFGPNSIDELKTTNKIRWRGFRITYLRRKIFRVSYGTRHHTSYDVWGFFQSTFESALEAWDIPVPEIIREGKASRDIFDKWPLKKIRTYNDAELMMLSEMTERLRQSINPLDLKINSWHGPGALASAWLTKNKVKGFLNAELPGDLIDASTRAYFGGRIDSKGYGIVNPVYHYDIVSAYPASIANLPALNNIEWERQKGRVPCGRTYVARIRWEIPATYWAPFPWRSRNGSIRYPLSGEGWYWFPEVEAAIEKYGEKHFDFVESWVANGDIQYPFRNLIRETFAYRRELKAQGHPSHIGVKLILNSLYGKFAQTVGSAKFFSPIWAGLITSQTRAQLMKVITDDVVCVMTDSIWSASPIDAQISSELGGWEKQNDNWMALAMAGLYEGRAPDGTSSIFQRGFDKRNPVDIEGLVNTWLYDDPTASAIYQVRRFVGMGLGTATSAPWRKWVPFDREIHAVPMVGTTKRLPLYPIEDEKEDSHNGFVSLRLRPRDDDEVSTPYAKLTANPALIKRRLEDECEE